MTNKEAIQAHCNFIIKSNTESIQQTVKNLSATLLRKAEQLESDYYGSARTNLMFLEADVQQAMRMVDVYEKEIVTANAVLKALESCSE